MNAHDGPRRTFGGDIHDEAVTLSFRDECGDDLAVVTSAGQHHQLGTWRIATFAAAGQNTQHSLDHLISILSWKLGAQRGWYGPRRPFVRGSTSRTATP